MKMNNTTAMKIHNLHMMTVANVEITHDTYNRLFANANVPSWATLKAHGLLIKTREEVRIEDDEVFTTTPAWERTTVYYILNV